MVKRVLVIFNPVSGAERFRATSELIQNYLKKEKIDFVWFETLPRKKQPFHDLKFHEFDRILVVGGDGTVREVAGFLIENNLKVPLAIIAQGTGNLLATALGVPIISSSSALRFALHGHPQSLDAMRVNQVHFALIAAGQGYDALFMRSTTRVLKRRFGFFAYVLSFLRTFFTYRNKKFQISVDGRRVKTKGKLALVLNLISLSGMSLHRDISPRDGLLDLIIVSPRTIWDLLLLVILYPFHGMRTPKLKYFRGKEIIVKELGGSHVQMDGEVISGQQLHVSVVPHALNVVYEKKF